MAISLVIKEYHAHVYFFDDKTKRFARKVRKGIKGKFNVILGKWHYAPIGPHPAPMYQIVFAENNFGEVVQWLIFNRNKLSILVHPETGHHLKDHFDNAVWIGKKLSLDKEFIKSLQK